MSCYWCQKNSTVEKETGGAGVAAINADQKEMLGAAKIRVLGKEGGFRVGFVMGYGMLGLGHLVFG